MATQAQLRASAKSALRATKSIYRRADTAGERLEREIERLLKRKTLLTPQSIAKLGAEIVSYIQLVNNLAKAGDDLARIITSLTVLL